MTSEHEERRRFHRIATDKAVEITSKAGSCSGMVMDISLRGLLLRCDSAESMPQAGEMARARVRLDDGDCCIEVEGTVAHVEDRQIGIHCTKLDLESAARLRRLVELNLADSELLERELTQLIRDQQH